MLSCLFIFLSRRFNTFQLEASSNCRYDYVAVYDGANTLAPLLGKFCGRTLPPKLRSSSNQMFIVFRTDASVSGLGWRATYSETLGMSHETTPLRGHHFIPTPSVSTCPQLSYDQYYISVMVIMTNHRPPVCHHMYWLSKTLKGEMKQG